MSSQLKEKQQTKSKEQIPTRDLQADFHFNQHLFRTVAYTAAGFGLGMASSLLFKHKAGMTIFFAGAGAGYGSADFVNDLKRFRNQRGPTQIKREGGASSQISEKLDRTADNLKGDLQKAKNKVERGVEDVSSQVAGKINQTAKGAEEWARNASEKATQHFQSKDYRRGGDDDKDKDDNKSGKKETSRKDESSLKKGFNDVKDQVKQSAESLKKDFKKDDSSLKKDAKDLKDQVKQSAESLKKDVKKDDSSLKKDAKDLKDQVKQSAESLKNNFKKDDTQKKDQKKDDSSLKKDAKDLKDQVKQSAESLKNNFKKDDTHKKDESKDKSKDQSKDGEKTSFNTTMRGGQTVTAKKEEGSKEHRAVGGTNLRVDQYTAKVPDVSAFQEGYSTPKPEQEGPVKVKREDKSHGGQGKSKADINSTINKGGQHFQDFRSNPHELGKGGELHDIKQDYQRNRNKAGDPEADAKRRASHQLAQDMHGESVHQGNNIRVNMQSETKQGFQNYKTGVAPGLQKNQVNATLE